MAELRSVLADANTGNLDTRAAFQVRRRTHGGRPVVIKGYLCVKPTICQDDLRRDRPEGQKSALQKKNERHDHLKRMRGYNENLPPARSAGVSWKEAFAQLCVAFVTGAVPLAALGIGLKPGLTLRGDVGVTHADPTGGRTKLRTHWANQQTGLVDDIVFELQVSPQNWGEIVFE